MHLLLNLCRLNPSLFLSIIICLSLNSYDMYLNIPPWISDQSILQLYQLSVVTGIIFSIPFLINILIDFLVNHNIEKDPEMTYTLQMWFIILNIIILILSLDTTVSSAIISLTFVQMIAVVGIYASRIRGPLKEMTLISTCDISLLLFGIALDCISYYVSGLSFYVLSVAATVLIIVPILKISRFIFMNDNLYYKLSYDIDYELNFHRYKLISFVTLLIGLLCGIIMRFIGIDTWMSIIVLVNFENLFIAINMMINERLTKYSLNRAQVKYIKIGIFILMT